MLVVLTYNVPIGIVGVCIGPCFNEGMGLYSAVLMV